jgi:ribose-phosphate pyrophosphokinase
VTIRGVATAVKKRFENDKVVISDIIGEVKGEDVIVIDDEIAKGSTLIELMGSAARCAHRARRLHPRPVLQRRA